MLFTIPLIQRIALFSCRKFKDAIKLHLVHPLFSETMIEYKTIQLVFVKLLVNAESNKSDNKQVENLKTELFNFLMVICTGSVIRTHIVTPHQTESTLALSWIVQELLEHPQLHFLFSMKGRFHGGRFIVEQGTVSSRSAARECLFPLRLALMKNNIPVAEHILNAAVSTNSSLGDNNNNPRLATLIRKQINGSPWPKFETYSAFVVSTLYMQKVMSAATVKFLHRKLQEIDPEISKNHILGLFGGSTNYEQSANDDSDDNDYEEYDGEVIFFPPLYLAIHDVSSSSSHFEFLINEAKNLGIAPQLLTSKMVTDIDDDSDYSQQTPLEIIVPKLYNSFETARNRMREMFKKILNLAEECGGKETVKDVLFANSNRSGLQLEYMIHFAMKSKRCDDDDNDVHCLLEPFKLVVEFARRHGILYEMFEEIQIQSQLKRSLLFTIAIAPSVEVFDYTFDVFQDEIKRNEKEISPERAVVECLRQVDSKGGTAFLACASSASFEVFCRFAEQIKKRDDEKRSLMKMLLLTRDERGNSPFLRACRRFNSGLVRQILSQAKEIEKVNDENEDIIKQLITASNVEQVSPILALANCRINSASLLETAHELLVLVISYFRTKDEFLHELKNAKKLGDDAIAVARKSKNTTTELLLSNPECYEKCVEHVRP